jgi:hypothetical protein
MMVAEAVRFELTGPCGPPVFKTGAIDHSATLPVAADSRRVRAAAIWRPMRHRFNGSACRGVTSLQGNANLPRLRARPVP